jgi:hypothetical protein
VKSLKRIIKPLASLRLTVVLLAASMFLILAGTLAQVNDGIWTVVDEYFRSFVVRIDFQLFVPKAIATIPGGIVFPGGLTLGILMFVNLLAAHTVRFKLTWKRSGIIITHLGVMLLLVGEFVTGGFADEGNMSIREARPPTTSRTSASPELAVIDRSSPDDDLVVVVPESELAVRNTRITNSLLPFEIHVEQWMPNSQLTRAAPGAPTRATAGIGRSLNAAPIPRATGVDGQTVDVASAFVTLSADGQPLGTYLVSVFMDEAQPVVVGGRTYWIELRFRRTYKPYSLHLIDFSHDKFVGTETPRNFSSLVRLVDPTRSVDREVLIYMNNPLRYAGETFYQASFMPDDSGTVLQVVRNPGWLIPYVSCTMVTVGMLIQFLIRLAPRKTRRGA